MRNRRVATAVAGMKVRKHRPEYMIILFMGLLMMLGLVIMYAIGPQRAQVLNTSYDTDFYTATYFFGKQAVSLALALAAFIIVAKTPIDWIERNAKKIFLAGVGLLAAMAVGELFKLAIIKCSLGACRWIDLGPIGSLQPAEFVKFGLLVYVAGFIAYRAKQGVLNDLYKSIIPLGAVLLLVSVFVIGIQRDMGTGLVMIVMLASMLMVAGISVRIGAMLIAAAVSFGVFMIAIAPHRIARVATFLEGDNASVTDAAGYHIAHAKIAIGSGGMQGVGIGNSVQATGYLPEAINDSVFAIMGEIFGFVGLVVVLLLFGALLMTLLKVADRLPGMYEKLIVAGVFGWLASHVVLNVAAMTGVFPLTGITLPLLSFGGTSMVFIAGALGLAFQLSSYTSHTTINERSDYEDSRSRRGLGRPRHASRGRL